MLRYWLFTYDSVSPLGGMNDLHGKYKTIEQAKEAAVDIMKKWPNSYSIDIYDSEADRVIWMIDAYSRSWHKS